MTDHDLNAREQRLKSAFIKARGYWRPWNAFLLRQDPKFLDVYSRYAGYPAAQGDLPAKTVELIYVALDSSATHLFASGLLLHMRLAMKAGASVREIIEVLRLGTAQGLTGTWNGIEILADELKSSGLALGEDGPLSGKQLESKQRYLRLYDEWPPSCEFILRTDPGYFERVCELLELEQDGEGLDAETRVILEIALNGCFTGFNGDALRNSIRRALRLPIDPRVILQVLQMTAHLGVHSCSIGLPLLEQAIAEP